MTYPFNTPRMQLGILSLCELWGKSEQEQERAEYTMVIDRDHVIRLLIGQPPPYLADREGESILDLTVFPEWTRRMIDACFAGRQPFRVEHVDRAGTPWCYRVMPIGERIRVDAVSPACPVGATP